MPYIHFLLLLILIIMPSMSAAETIYEDVDFRTLTQFYIDKKPTIDLSNTETFNEYAQIENCAVYNALYDDDFAWLRLKEEFLSQSLSFLGLEKLHLKTPLTIEIDRYNFKTKSFDVAEESRLKNVGFIRLSNPRNARPCNRSTKEFIHLPTSYKLLVNNPVSLYRIPMAQKTAELLLKNMVVSTNKKRMIFATLYMTVDGVKDNSDTTGLQRDTGNATLKGQLDRIEFFMDQQRTRKIKTLRYDAF